MKKGLFIAKSKVFYKVYLANIANTIIFIFLISFISIRSNTQFILDNSINFYQENISFRRNILDDRIRQLDDYVSMVVEQEDVLDYMFYSDRSQIQPTDLMKIVLYLQQICDNNKILHEISLVDFQNGIVMDNMAMYSLNEQDFQQETLSRGGLQLKETDEGLMIRYVRPFNPLNMNKNIFIVLTLNTDTFYSNLLSRTGHDLQSYEEYLLSEDGSTVNWDGRKQLEPEIMDILKGMEQGVQDVYSKGENLLIYKEDSEYSDWSIVWVQNHTSLRKQSSKVMKTIVVACICMMLLASVLIYLLADFLYKPLKQLGNRVRLKIPDEKLNPDNEYQAIEHAVDWLEKEHDVISRKYQDTLPILVQNCIYDLIINQYEEEQFRNFKTLTGKKMQWEHYFLLICECGNGEEDRRTTERINVFLEQDTRMEGSWAAIPTAKTVWLLNTDLVYGEVVDILRYLKQSMSDIHAVWYMSRMFNNVENMNLVYSELVIKQKQKFFKGKNALIYEEESKLENRDIIEKRKIQTEILKYIKEDNEQKVREELHCLTEKLTKGENEIQYICFQYFEVCFRMINTLMELNGKGCSIQEEKYLFGQFFSVNSIEELEQIAGDLLVKQMCSRISKDSDYSDNVKKAMEYIQKHYQTDLSLEHVAGAVYLSAGYMSGIFKNETGNTVFEYINHIRMQKARELLLQNPTLKIKDVSDGVGYNNIQSFLRCFKRYYGTTPVEFRRAQGVERDTGSLDTE